MDVAPNDDDGSTTTIESRLKSLFSNTASSSRSSLDVSVAQESTSNMRRARYPQLPSPASSSSSASRKSHSKTMSETPGYSLPVLRWFGNWTESDTPSPELQEALNENCISTAPRPHVRTPPKARLLSSSSISSRTFTNHAPPFFSDLSRATLPTSSVSGPPRLWLPPNSSSATSSPTNINSENTTSHRNRDDIEDIDTPFIIRDQSPPTRTSIDTLRSLTLRDRGMALPPTDVAPSRMDRSPTRWWIGKENKQAVDSLLHESDQADTIEHEQANIQRKYLSPKHPLVFCHGLLGFDSVQLGLAIAPLQVSHWRGIKEVLEAAGCEVLITRVPATSSPIERAKVLEETVSKKYPGRKVHLIGHSMGGLDCRYLTTHLTQRKFSILSVTTVGTPHRGSAFADYVLNTLGRERLETVVALLEFLPNGGGDGKAFESLTMESMRKFNEETPDVEGVKYFSWGAKFEPGLIDKFKWPHSVILEQEGPNDGLVSVESSKWGTYLGTLDDVNHLDLVGWVNTARYKWAELFGQEIKFKPATFYLGVADHLARVVERGEVESATRTGKGEGPEPSIDGGQQTNSDGVATNGESAYGTQAGAGVKTVEGVEKYGPEGRRPGSNGSGSPSSEP